MVLRAHASAVLSPAARTRNHRRFTGVFQCPADVTSGRSITMNIFASNYPIVARARHGLLRRALFNLFLRATRRRCSCSARGRPSLPTLTR